MPVTCLKRKHSLKGKDLLPFVKRIKDNFAISGQAARMASQLRTEDLDLEELKSHFKDLTGKKAEEILQLTGKELSRRNFVVLLHHGIIYANEKGQPGENLRETVVSSIAF